MGTRAAARGARERRGSKARRRLERAAAADGDRERDARLVLRPRGPKPLDELVERALALVEAGAAIVDVGGESGRHRPPAVPAEEEIERVVPLVERLAATGSTCRWTPGSAPVARAALAAGAAIVNDVSGLSDLGVADACAELGRRAGDHAHARAAEGEVVPALRRRGRRRRAFLRERIAVARARGVGRTRSCSTRAGPRQDARRDDRAAAPPAGAGRAGPPAAARGVAQGLRRRAHRPRAGRARLGARWPRGRGLADGGAHPARARRGGRARLPARARGARRRATAPGRGARAGARSAASAEAVA